MERAHALGVLSGPGRRGCEKDLESCWRDLPSKCIFQLMNGCR